MRTLRTWMLTLALGVSTGSGPAVAASRVFREALVLEAVGRSGRNTLFTDAVEASRVVGTWRAPQVGDVVVSARDGTARAWTNASANAEGWWTGREMRGGWAYFTHDSAEPAIVLFRASGHSMAYINGEPRAGDIYGNGYVALPIQLVAGRNEFLIATGRGRLRVECVDPPAPVFLQAEDLTVPDLIVGEKTDAWMAAVLVNARADWLRGATVRAKLSGTTTDTKVGDLPPLGVRKVPIRLRGSAPKEEGKAGLTLTVSVDGKAPGAGELLVTDLRIRKPDQTHKRTFVSAIDGSVQYYAVHPALAAEAGPAPALYLSFHGASVEAMGQAEAYGQKRGGVLVAPTNRRPYGFDWEEWGRLDALEVLGLATARWRPDPSRIYLTGHSMGGHGTWNFGATFPDRFAAIGPSAGWISFFSYAGTAVPTNPTPIEAILKRAVASSDTLAMATNYLHHGVYVVHGDADDNVPVREARTMREVLGRFHRDFDAHEQ
ncbi:MAG: prolyl oligopeptidase family serine peptidase, partial [Verrucomicrobiales bacterium]|nr:prolyl oligopeptidase family serine peptidase [Verrucomicrobiales bacterium]